MSSRSWRINPQNTGLRLARPRDRVALAHDPLYINYRTRVLEFLYHRQSRPHKEAA